MTLYKGPFFLEKKSLVLNWHLIRIFDRGIRNQPKKKIIPVASAGIVLIFFLTHAFLR